MRERAKQITPWIVSLAMCGVLLWPFRDESGRAALVEAAHHASPWTIPVIALFAILNWISDAWATGSTFRYLGTRISVRDALLVRGATLIFEAVNPSMGQVALGVAMFRRGTALARTLQTLVLLNVVFVLQLVCIAGIGLSTGRHESSGMTVGVVATALVVACAYVAVIAAKPSFLAKRASLALLFETGLQGHAFAFAVRIPSMTCIFVAQLATLECFGVSVPIAAVLVYVPAIILITGVPVSVQGIGPVQLAQVAFFASFVNVADPRAAEAAVVAWGLTFSVGTAASSFLIGLGCMLTKVGRSAFVAGRTANTEELANEPATVVRG